MDTLARLLHQHIVGDGLGGKQISLGKVHIKLPVECTLAERQDTGRAGEQPVDNCVGFGVQLLRLDDFVDEAVFAGPFHADNFAGHQHLKRHLSRHIAR